TYCAGLYRTIRPRPAARGGLITFVRFWRAGGTRQQRVDILWQSDEHRGLEVDKFYRTILTHGVDPATRANLVAGFHSGLNENGLEAMLLTSPEFLAAHPAATDFSNAVYLDRAGRSANTANLAAWQPVIQTARPR